MSRLITRIVALVFAVVTLAAITPLPSDERFVEPNSALQPVFRVERAMPPLVKAPPERIRFPVATRRTAALPEIGIAEQTPPSAEVVAPLPFIAGDGPPMRGTRIAQTGRLDVYVGLRTFTPEQIAAIAPRLEELLRGNEERFGFQLQQRVSIAFYRPSLAPSKDTRGIAYTEEGRAEVYYRPNEDIERALVVASHELAHHLQAQRYGDDAQKRADIILLEGLATWITGPPWLAKYGVARWKERARQIGDSGVPLRLLNAQRYGDNIAYELWASFVDFLIERDGMEKMHALYVSGRGREPGSADYQGIYGASLNELANEWRVWVRS
ncbi:hypothetical protein [Roseiflexus sp.]|uniref:hypothetical protein n=1 Tax=Roseiflexus sp. TaxID=2562120 RepID=UPI0021DD61DB|nr:hypothetical protein [Roseiflexus sp.]GIV99117.1 MAG: hypothetical protein KatS3mg058_0521 [Roseiflexus sp.]